jgi:hypothetical protein
VPEWGTIEVAVFQQKCKFAVIVEAGTEKQEVDSVSVAVVFSQAD